MWPVSLLQQRRHRKRYNAALFIYLGAYLFSTMRPEDRARVEAKVTELLKQIGASKPAHARYASPSLRAFCRALAMQRLDTPTSIDGVTWDGLLPRRDAALRWEMRFFDFHPRSPATTEAIAFLRARGLDVPDVLHDAYAEAHPPPRQL